MPDRLNRNAPTIVEILTDVPSQWNGWLFSASGRHLIGPDGDRITPQRLSGLLWRDAMELRRARLTSRREAESRFGVGRSRSSSLTWRTGTPGTWVAARANSPLVPVASAVVAPPLQSTVFRNIRTHQFQRMTYELNPRVHFWEVSRNGLAVMQWQLSSERHLTTKSRIHV